MERRSTKLISFVAAAMLFWTIAAPSAHAYIDPGSTNFIIQILIGALAGAGLAIATFWRRIKLFFMRGKSKGDVAPSTETDGGPTTPDSTPSEHPGE